MKKKYKTLHTKERTFDIISFLAEAQDVNKVTLLEDITDALFDAGSNYPKNARMLIDVLGNKVTIVFAGRPVVQSGSFQMPTETPDKEVDKEVKKKVEENGKW